MKNIPKLKEYHITKNGDRIKISDLTNDHLQNIMLMYVRVSKGGQNIGPHIFDDNKGSSGGAHNVRYDGVALLKHFNVLSYVVEWNKRDLPFLDYSQMCKHVGGNGSIYWEDIFEEDDDPQRMDYAPPLEDFVTKY
jgi:hypothetical protein